MEAFRVSPVHSLGIPPKLDKTQFRKLFCSNFNSLPSSCFSLDQRNVSKSKLCTAISSSVSTELADPFQPELETQKLYFSKKQQRDDRSVRPFGYVNTFLSDEQNKCEHKKNYRKQIYKKHRFYFIFQRISDS